MAAVTITVNRKGVATALRGRCKIWLNAGTSGMYPQVLVHHLECSFYLMDSDNPWGEPDNQQERPLSAWYVTGFMDGEVVSAYPSIERPPVAGGTSDPWFRRTSTEIELLSWNAYERSLDAARSDQRDPTVVW
jgi:hypothetical protein